MSADSRRVIRVRPGSDTGDSAVGRELTRALEMAPFLLVIGTAVLAWAG
jgi:hypothetical protein